MDFPRTVDEITPEWLTQVLRESGAIDQVEVDSLTVAGLDGGVASEVQKIEIQYDRRDGQAPTSIIAKIAHRDEEARSIVDDLGLYEREILFYRHFGQTSGIPVPAVYFSAYDSSTGTMLLLQEDLSKLRSVAAGENCSLDDAVKAFDAVAAMHAKWWGDESLFDLRWLVDCSDEEYATGLSEHYSPHIESLVEIAGDYLPKGVEQIVRDLAPKFAEVVAHSGTRPVTLNHGDYKPANIFFDDSESAESPIMAFDWQVAQRGRPGLDIGMFLMTSFDNHHRVDIEQELISRYHDALLDGGVTGYSKDELNFDIQVGLLSRIPFRTLALVYGADNLLATEAGTVNFASMADRMQTLIDWNCDEVIPK